MAVAIRAGLAALLLAAAVPAQVGVGQAAPELPVALAPDAALALRGADAPPALLVVFHRDAGAAAGDADLLRSLLARHRDQGLRVVVVLPELPAPPPPALRELQLAGDRSGRARASWLGEDPGFHVLLVAQGRVLWVGTPAQGLPDAVARALAGTLDAAAQRALRMRREVLAAAFDDEPALRARLQCRELLAGCATDGDAWGMLYLVEADRLADGAAAAAVAAEALAALAAAPRALAAFADLALRGAPCCPPFAEQLVAPLDAAAAALPGDPQVQLARLRALVHAGRGRDVGRAAQQLARIAREDGAAALALVDILSQDEPAAVHRDVAGQALAAAERLGSDPRLLCAARYAFLLRCAADRAAAQLVLDDYLDQLPARVAINNDAWYLMTEPRSRGRFDVFALALVERMLQQQDAMDDFEFDTAALALFRAGRLAEAVALQQTAVDRGGKDNPGYAERLRRYRAALPPAPR